MSTLHASLTGDQLHELFHYVADSDPGAVGAGKYWLDTSSEPYSIKRRNDDDDGWVDVGSAGSGGAPTDADYVVGTANGSLSAEIVKSYLRDNVDPEAYPGSPDDMDDEFEGGGSLDVKWSLVNDPGIDQSTYPGYVRVPLSENTGTDNLAARIQMYQTPPTGTQTLAWIAKVATAIDVDAHQTDKGEFAGAGIYLMNSVNSEFIYVTVQYNNANEANGLIYRVVAEADSGFFSNHFAVEIPISSFVYLKLAKTTADGYTSANTYAAYLSANGIIWHLVGSISKSFTADCDRVGLIFRRPKSQNGSPSGEAIVDFFRRID